jgi:hypothetical protein
MIIASSRAAFLKGYDAPGTFIAASATLAEKPLEEVLDAGRQRFKERDKCILTTAGTTFTRGGYAGIFDLWDGCGGTTSRFLTIVAKKTDGSHIVHIQFQAPEPADLAILDRMLVTLEFAP